MYLFYVDCFIYTDLDFNFEEDPSTSQSATCGQFHTCCSAHSDCQKSTCNPKVNDKEMLQKLWAVSARQVGLGNWDPFTAEDNGELPPEQTQTGHH
jgi:hypothetical protein